MWPSPKASNSRSSTTAAAAVAAAGTAAAGGPGNRPAIKRQLSGLIPGSKPVLAATAAAGVSWGVSSSSTAAAAAAVAREGQGCSSSSVAASAVEEVGLRGEGHETKSAVEVGVEEGACAVAVQSAAVAAGGEVQSQPVPVSPYENVTTAAGGFETSAVAVTCIDGRVGAKASAESSSSNSHSSGQRGLTTSPFSNAAAVSEHAEPQEVASSSSNSQNQQQQQQPEFDLLQPRSHAEAGTLGTPLLPLTYSDGISLDCPEWDAATQQTDTGWDFKSVFSQLQSNQSNLHDLSGGGPLQPLVCFDLVLAKAPKDRPVRLYPEGGSGGGAGGSSSLWLAVQQTFAFFQAGEDGAGGSGGGNGEVVLPKVQLGLQVRGHWGGGGDLLACLVMDVLGAIILKVKCMANLASLQVL